MESMFFIYDGIQSTQMGLYIMRIDHSGFIETPYWGEVNIYEEKTRKKLTPYFYGIDREPIEFTVQFFLADEYMRPKKWTPQERYRIAKWLVQDTYKLFQTSDDLGKYYYAMAVSNTNLNLINSEGFIEVTFRTNSPFAWSPIYVQDFDLSNNTSSTIIELENKSNVLKYFRPKIEFELIGDTTDVQFKNLSNSGKIMKFEGLDKGEIISIDCENRIIKSNLVGSNPFAKFNIGMKRYWLDLAYGINRIEVQGEIKLFIKSQFPIAQ